ncbi:hypothetical protein PCS_02600 [Desulfocurvibacter africanus PCS]|uniref:Uncharacterized protein n=1 Tax=Desulfocurvibacter africanus PCS TaxID=1262666 RepID=M5Q1I7_DESAF|nr:hypothetical protein [Desulfocurvibacter africanus]EMG36588.1 hypothetical protein PCS_02600 [Desulfocurvibacter africanus PCS]
MLYIGSAIEQQKLRTTPLRDANPEPNRRVRGIPWQGWAWAIVLAAVAVIMSGSW